MSVLSFPSTEPVGGFASCTCCALTYIIVKIHIVSILFQVSVPKMKHKPTRQQKKVAKGYSSPEPDVQDSSGSEGEICIRDWLLGILFKEIFYSAVM